MTGIGFATWWSGSIIFHILEIFSILFCDKCNKNWIVCNVENGSKKTWREKERYSTNYPLSIFENFHGKKRWKLLLRYKSSYLQIFSTYLRLIARNLFVSTSCNIEIWRVIIDESVQYFFFTCTLTYLTSYIFRTN